jgi:hypothetical protein
MDDRAWSSTCVVAYALWTTSGLLMVMSMLVWDDAPLTEHLGRLALILCGVAMTATIRSYFVCSNRLTRQAFDYGRESAAFSGDNVRTLN